MWQSVIIVCGSCCLLMVAASCLLILLGWILRRIRPGRRMVYDTPANNDAGEVIEGEYKDIAPGEGKG